MTRLLFDACPKCWADPQGKTRGTMRLNEDNDLSNIQVNVFRIRERNISDDGKLRPSLPTKIATDLSPTLKS